MSSRTAVETIQAAIEKLEALKAESTVGRWEVTNEGLTHPRGLDIIAGRVFVAADGEGYQGAVTNHVDAELIVTLHRTIDAQLAILNEAKVTMMSRERLGLPLNTGPVRALALARAILGEES